ncbi:MAG TPA: hypothetical protein VMU76_07270 [Acidimicrobiales bacterium]|nr:hypothetical protein [Acidimicrobiales bacterium]
MDEQEPAEGRAGGVPGRTPPAKGPGVGGTLPAYYAAGRGGWRDWWTLLHPPYTAWHLAYVVIGASLAPRVNLGRLMATLAAFFLAVGLGAHALDELEGRPLRTTIPAGALVATAAAGILGAVGLGIAGITQIGWPLVPFLVAGPILVVAYNFELFGGHLHNDLTFALAWGCFPVLTAYVAQTGRLALAPVLAAAGTFGFSVAQRRLSTPARFLRRRAATVEGSAAVGDGGRLQLDRAVLLAPLEHALRAMSWAMVLLAASLAVARMS